MVILFVLIWLLIGILEYGLSFAYLQREFPTLAKQEYWSDVCTAVVFGLFGPMAIIATVICGWYIHGVKFK